MSTHAIAHPGARANTFTQALNAIRRFFGKLLVRPWTEPISYRFVMRGDPRSIDALHVEKEMRESLVRDGVRNVDEFAIHGGFEIEQPWLYKNLTYERNVRDYSPYAIVAVKISRKAA